MKFERDTMDDTGIGFALARGWEGWVFGIQIGRRLWAVTW